MSPKPDLQNEAKLVEETAPRLASVNPTSRKEKIGQGEGIEGLEEGGEDEEEEEGQYGGDEEEEEEEVGDLGGSPLALSESSESAVSSPGTLQRMEEEEGEGWSGLLASTPQHSPHRGEPGQRGQEWRTTKEEGLTDNIKDGEEDKEEEEVMSLASEESELSVPELQETMEKLSMLASEGMSFGEGDKNDPNSPNSPGSVLSHASPNSSVSQNPKETEGLCEGEEPMHREGGSYKSAGKGVSSWGKRRGAGRGRDQSEVKRDGSGCRPHQRLTHRGRKKQGRRGMSKPTPPLNEDDARDSDLAMESQDMAFAQAYLRRVCAAVWEAPGKVDEFLRVLYEFQQGGDRSSLVGLFGQLKSVLKDWPELLQDFAAFLQPEQARECGLLVEQQAFERSRRFLRQLEMSFEESPAHFQRIVHALQEGPSLTPAGLREMKSQIASLLKNHTHLQTEFWEFFDDIIASSQSVCPEGVAPSDATASQRPRRGARRRLNEVTHPVSEEGEESQKLGTPKKEEGPVCDWSVGGKDRPYRGSKRAAKPRRVSRKHGSVSRRKRGELSSPGSSTLPRGLHPEKRVGRRGEERRKGGNGVNIPHPAKEREEETEDVREKKEQEASQHEGRGGAGDDTPASQPNSVNSSPNPPVCAQNVSLMPTGEKVILWTREADRMILTACQQKGAKHSTFKTVSTQLGNKTANEVNLVSRYGSRSSCACSTPRPILPATRITRPPLTMTLTEQNQTGTVVIGLSAALVAASDVLELSDGDFDYTSAEHETMLVEFFAPWCGHCQKLAPEYESAATKLKGIVPLAKVDCTTNSETCSRFGVNGYPTLKIFRNGEEASSYDGPRSAGFFSGSDSEQLAEFQKAASAMRDSYRFGHTTDLGLGLKHGVETESVLLFRPPRLNNKFEESEVKFDEGISTSSLRRFIRDNIFGMCPHLTSENRDKLKGRDLLTAYYEVDYLRNPKGSNYWRNSYSVADRREFLEELEDEFGLGLSDGGELPMVTIRTREGHKYTMREEFTRDGKALERFLEEYFAGRLKRYLKSQPVPESNKGPVKVVVAETFEEIVNDPEKDVLIEFYAPWCGHCKNLEPKYNELGEQLSSDPNIVIAKMDATANDVPSGYDVQGFPTIYFAPAGKKEAPKRYEGGREVKDFLSYLKKEAAHSLVLSGGREDL
ncbi:hypothetical protein JZ751_000126 [Albula glossodonta]|uniref:protein disulfide-isomerase n=1 Tax=Albula glossodonta TaxID=121402 RepID=A0A8T2PVI5_9TELE|nr:hypothetical protein JZ751_000126 [Albula glossodonta]